MKNIYLISNNILPTTKGFLVPSEQVEAPPARGLVRVVSQLAAFPQLGAAAEAGARLEGLVALAGEGGELALGGDGVGEEFVGAPVVAEVAVSHVVARVGCNQEFVSAVFHSTVDPCINTHNK